jgi:hypothetical protein
LAFQNCKWVNGGGSGSKRCNDTEELQHFWEVLFNSVVFARLAWNNK